ncbi:ACHA7-like protein, partial [Mya arenaria]
MQVRWTAANLPEWDKDELGGKTTFSLDSSTIWTPQFLLLNPATTVKDLAATSNRLRINNNQTAACVVDVADFPFDKQTCDVNIAVWGYDTTEVTLHPIIRNSARDISYIESSTWSLRKISIDGKNTAVNTPYFQVTLLIERHYEYFLVNVILPPTLLSVLDPCVFLLPASSGERMSFAVTCFLAFSVFMTLLGDNLPKSSVPVAHMAYFMMYMLIHSCAVTFCTIITLRVYNKVDTAEQIPDWVKFVVRLLRLRFCRYRKPTLKSNEVEP